MEYQRWQRRLKMLQTKIDDARDHNMDCRSSCGRNDLEAIKTAQNHYEKHMIKGEKLVAEYELHRIIQRRDKICETIKKLYAELNGLYP